MAKIALNMIVRNCADFITKALDSTLGQIDYYVIGFGGKSEDQTEKVIKEWLNINAPETSVVTYIIWKDDFADARNQVLAKTKEAFPDADWLFWVDADDTLKTKIPLHEIIENNKNAQCIQFAYLYQPDDKGNVNVWHARERLVYLPYQWRWVRPVHETLITNIEHLIVYTDSAVIVHDPTKTTDRSERNRKILLRWLEENPSDKRTNLYLGHSYYSNGDYEEAIKWFAKYFFDSENFLEQWSAAIFAGRSALGLEQYEEASGWFHHAIDLRPEWKDGWIGLGIAHTRLGNYDAAVSFFKESDDKSKPPNVLFIVENEYTWNRWCYEHEALSNTGKTQEALEICTRALEVTPEHPGFKYYYFGYKEIIEAEKSIKALEHLALTLLRRGDGIKALRLIDTCVPVNIQEEDKLANLRNYVYSCIEHVWNKDLLFELNKKGNADGSENDENSPKDDTFNLIDMFARVQEMAKMLEPHIKKAKNEVVPRKLRVLDLACAGGGITMWLAEKLDIEIVGVDGDEDSVKAANERAKKWGVNNVSFVKEDLFILDPLSYPNFDVVLLQEIIEHTDKPALFVGTATDIAPVVMISTPHQLVIVSDAGKIKNPRNEAPLSAHVIEFSRADMEKLGMISGYSIHNLYDVYDEVAPVPGHGSWIMELRQEKKSGLPVVFYCGHAGGEDWTPKQIDKTGLGGSETAAIRMAEGLANKGYLSIIYGPTNGIYNGVIYRDSKKFDPLGPALGQPALLFVSSRIPEVVDNGVNAVYKALWCHDNTFKLPVAGGIIDRLTPERVEQFDSIFVLSEWAKKFMKKQYPFVPEEKWVVTSNGINIENFENKTTERVPHSFIYASSADRGLERILEIWPKIKKMWKDAELDIFYGLDVMQKIHGHIPEVQNFMQKISEMSEQKGVNWKGRIGQRELAEEFSKHQYWLYPTAFEETFCITALEAQAGGCIPLTTSVAALKERVPEEFRVDWKNGSEFISKLKELDNKYNEAPKKLAKEALTYTWDKPVTQWETLVQNKVKEYEKRAKD